MTLDELKRETLQELTDDILHFWMDRTVDPQNGGFYGQITGQGVLMPQSEKGVILNSRILWTFSSAYRLLAIKEYLLMATRAKDYLLRCFYDHELKGVYWTVDFEGKPLETKKQIYALSFALYGLSEYHRATGDEESLRYAVELFETIEKYSFDSDKNGYWEALTRDWQPIEDMRLSDKDENLCKTTNTHLHIMEAYMNLYRVWKDERLRNQLRNLICLFRDRIVDPETGHLKLFFDDEWNTQNNLVSYGHDIETSWLLHEAAMVLGDEDLLAQIEKYALLLALAADEGLNKDGSMNYEMSMTDFHLVTDRHWWVQAENVVGHVNLYQHFGNEEALQRATEGWAYIKQHLIDNRDGEWFWSVSEQGVPNRLDDKVGLWKCPYHNSRMCMEILERFREDRIA